MQIAHSFHKPICLLSYLVVLFVVASCSSGTTAPSDTSSTAQSITPIPSYQFVLPTEPPQFATMAAAITNATATSNENPDPEKIARGKDRYEVLGCAACHGENGEGTDEASVLAGMRLSEADFISFLRSGGTVGSSHQYASNRLSESGGENLYLYLLSLDIQEAQN